MSQFLKKIYNSHNIDPGQCNLEYVILNRTVRPQIAMKDSLSMQYITQSKLKHLHRNRMISNADINQNLRLIMFTRKN